MKWFIHISRRKIEHILMCVSNKSFPTIYLHFSAILKSQISKEWKRKREVIKWIDETIKRCLLTWRHRGKLSPIMFTPQLCEIQFSFQWTDARFSSIHIDLYAGHWTYTVDRCIFRYFWQIARRITHTFSQFSAHLSSLFQWQSSIFELIFLLWLFSILALSLRVCVRNEK